MLSILPYERVSQREEGRPFKSYQRSSSAVHPYYNPFSSSPFPSLGFGSSKYPADSTTMDLRSQYPESLTESFQSPRGIIDIKPSHIGSYGQHPMSSMSAMYGGSNNDTIHSHNSLGMMSQTHNPLGLQAPGTTSSSTMGLHSAGGLDVMSHSSHLQTGMSSTQPPQICSSSTTPIPSHANHYLDPSGSPAPQGSNSSASSSSSDSPATPQSFKMPPKKRPLAVPDEKKDGAYWDKRKKNNDSAKRSRDARRMKEEQIAMKVVYLEQDNLQLRTEVSLLKSEIEKLRCMLYNS